MQVNHVSTKLIRLGLVIFATLAYLLIFEAVLQVHQLYVRSRYGPNNAQDFLHGYDPIRGWRNKPNTTAPFVVSEERIRTNIQINAKGLRGPELDYKKPQGIRRILLLGDSMVAGFEVDQDETVAARLEELLSRNSRWQVINAGTRGYGTDQSFLFLTTEGHRYGPDLVIYFFAPNDVENNLVVHGHGKKYGKSYFSLGDDRSLELKGTPVPAFDIHVPTLAAHPAAQRYYEALEGRPSKETQRDHEQKLPSGSYLDNITGFLYNHSLVYKFLTTQLKRSAPLREFFYRLGMTSYGNLSREEEAMMAAGWELTEHLLVDMKSFCESIGAQFIVFEVVNGGRYSRPANELLEISEINGIPLIRSYETFLEQSRKGRKLRWKDQIHWTPTGHAAAAKLVYQFLNDNGWVEQ